MPYLIEPFGKSKKGDLYLLTHTVDKSVNVVFSRSDFRDVLTEMDYSPGRIGSILRLLNERFPVKYDDRPTLKQRYSEGQLTAMLVRRGFRVYEPEPNLSVPEAIRILEMDYGKCVEGPSGQYKSPFCAANQN